LTPLSNKINIPLLIIATAFLIYYLIALITILSGEAFLVGPIYPLYISTGVIVLCIIGIFASIRARYRWERDHNVSK